ncbi:hypothetical protein BN1200_190072 [Klebsiella variicola]|nr:hypothetical protein BN1200_190072 [Klebsiella variicola]
MKPLLDVLVILDALEKEGSFAAASAKLFKTPSALSYTIHRLKAISISSCSTAAVTARALPPPDKCCWRKGGKCCISPANWRSGRSSCSRGGNTPSAWRWTALFP